MKSGSARIPTTSVVQRFTRPLRAATATLLTACFGTAAAFENGPIPGHTGALGQPDCTACHFDNDANSRDGSVTLGGLPETYSAGQQYAISVTLEDDGLASGGFQLTVGSPEGGPVGQLDSTQTDVIKISDGGSGHSYIQHGKPRDMLADANDIEWTVVWTAPDENGAIIVAVAAVAANDDDSPLGDKVYTTVVHLQSAGGSSKNEDRPKK